MQSKIPKINKKFSPKNCTNNSIYLNPVNEKELITHIGTLKNNSAPGEDEITSIFIKNVHKNILKPLIHLINLSFSLSKIPTDWKSSLVTPIFKTGDPQLLTNYRPISVISNFAKIFEKCLKQRLINFLEHENILYKKQFGFRKNRNTEDAVFELTNNLIYNLNNNKKCLAVFLDLAKAFDTVCHKILFERLDSVGIRGKPLKLFEDYLSNRIQKVKLNNIISNGRFITTGVPQGTVLGPILFLLYINEIGNLPIECSVISYADDTALLFYADTWTEVYRKAEIGLSLMLQWLSLSLLSLNTSKTYFITFSASAVDQPEEDILKIHTHDCNINNNKCICPEIAKVHKTKYLGVIIDQHLKWNEHANYLTTKMRKLFYKFYQLRDILSRKLIKILYMSLVESILRYCIIAWGGLYQNAMRNLSVCQNTILKIIFRKEPMFSTVQLYKDTGVLNIRSLYVYCCLNYITKISELRPAISHIYQTRSITNELLQIPLCNKSVSQRFITYYAPKFYNILPDSIRYLLYNKKKFKIETKAYILTHSDKFIQVLNN